MQVFLGLYRVNKEITSKRLVYKFCLPIAVTALLVWVRKRPCKDTRICR